MEALEQALSVLPPDPGIWKEMKSPEDRSGEGAGPPLLMWDHLCTPGPARECP